MKHRLLATPLLLLPPSAVLADAPAFDRPGIGFGTTVLPVGSLAWEQGLPDVTRLKADGDRSTRYDANTLIRYGLHEKVELQLGGAIRSRLEEKSAGGVRDSATGTGDLSAAVKAVLPSDHDTFSWAVLAGASLPTGSRHFTQDHTQLFAGITTAFALSDTQGVALYYNVSHDSDASSFTFSPSWSYQVSERLGAYVEAGYTASSGPDDDDYVAGGGLVYMLTPRIQADLYGLRGLGSRSTDLQAGLGISVFFD